MRVQDNYIVVGQMGSGKDEVGNYLQKHHGYQICKLGDPIRHDCDDLIELLGLLGDPRDYYQEYGQGLRNMFAPTIWCRLLERRIVGNGPYIIADARQPEEIEFWVERGYVPIGVKANKELRRSRLIRRDGVDQEKYFNHETEVSAGAIIESIAQGKLPGHVLTNEGTMEEFQEAIENVCGQGVVL